MLSLPTRNIVISFFFSLLKNCMFNLKQVPLVFFSPCEINIKESIIEKKTVKDFIFSFLT